MLLATVITDYASLLICTAYIRVTAAEPSPRSLNVSEKDVGLGLAFRSDPLHGTTLELFKISFSLVRSSDTIDEIMNLAKWSLLAASPELLFSEDMDIVSTPPLLPVEPVALVQQG